MPRDVTAEVVFDCSRFARALANDGTPYGVFEFDCSDLCHSLRSGFLLLRIRFAAFFIVRC